MGQWYWISEYFKLLLAYDFVLYVWPQVVFENHLKGRSLTYRYGFCVTVTVLLVNTMVLLLGLIHCLRPWVTTVLFLGLFFWRLFVNHPPFRILAKDMQSLHNRTMSSRRLFMRAWQRLKAGISAWFAPVASAVRGHRFEYGLLLIALLFGTVYFSWGAFDGHSYGFGDQYVHHQWIHGLTEGKAFYNGIYPEAMHCMIYLTCTLFRIPLYSGVLFFAGLHVHVLLISAWLFMKEVFNWRYTAPAALAAFLCLDQLCIDEVFAMSRLSWTLPMEYALYTSFLSGLFLLRFLRRVMRGERVRLHPLKLRQWGVLRDEDLFLFAGAVAVSLAVHFYITIVAFFFCAVIALVYIRQVFRRGSFLPLAAAVMLSLTVAVVPMAAALAMGYPLQGSLLWAVRVVEQGEDNAVISGQQTSEASGDSSGEQETAGGEADAAEGQTDTETAAVETAPAAPEASELPEDSSIGQEIVYEPPKPLPERLKEKAEVLYRSGYNTVFPGRRSLAVLAATAFAIVFALAARLILTLRDFIAKRRAEEKEETATVIRDRFDGILIVALISLIFMIMYSAAALGLPELVAGSRLLSTEEMLLVMLYAFPLDCLMALLARFLHKRLMQVLALAAFLGVYIGTQMGGVFHSYPYFELTRYSAAVEMTNHIMDTLPPQTYTIISTTDELYQVIENGFHEELLIFIEQEHDETYTIPTKYLLLYIEKKPIKYAQYHFANGPEWLARKEYPELYVSNASQCPEILCTEISKMAAGDEIFYGGKLSDSATNAEGRRVLESKAYQWYTVFSSMHPRDCRVVYEDDDFMCCCITQNPASLYTLGVMGGSGK